MFILHHVSFFVVTRDPLLLICVGGYSRELFVFCQRITLVIPRKETTTTTYTETLDESEKQCQLAACKRQPWSLTRHGSRQAAEIVGRGRGTSLETARNARISALQLRQQLSRAYGRTKLRRLHMTLPTGACQQRAIIENM